MQADLALTKRLNAALFSPCGTYRYLLTRELGGDRPLVICGLNPSTATAEIDDQTIRTEMGFARRWGCGRLVKVNAYGFRATDPDDLKRARKAGADVVGPDNLDHIRTQLLLARFSDGVVLVAWGNHIERTWQAELSSEFDGVDAYCIGTNKNGTPKHTLYQPHDAVRVPWSCP